MRTEISNVDELRDVLGQPHERVLRKDRTTLAPEQIAWLKESPFCLLPTPAADARRRVPQR